MYRMPNSFGRVYVVSHVSNTAHPTKEIDMSTIAKAIASLAVLSALAAPAAARFDGDDSALSAYARFGSEHNANSGHVLVNRPAAKG